ncbi:zinc finger protein 276 isoform X2 [Meriones unguiculatus]|uniref:zinc finger protein 276 isoform X2 n=1 Tax=Meriones unguiculatus TaxID=10047 RepID=UPI00293F5FF5|nr:zinc finger protein 276 isoform X2 [Meriones unguiculatus]
MKRDRLGRFLSPGTARQRGSSGGSCGSGRTRGRPSRTGGASADRAAAQLSWGSARSCEDTGEDGTDEAGAGRTLAMGHCRLCHGKFSSRSLRSISDRVPGETSERLFPGERIFIRDFQRLLGVAVHQDPALPQFVCKNCYTQFYQCHSLLRSFLQRVNVSPAGQRKPCPKVGVQPPTVAEEGACMADLITSSPRCLHSLVGWVHEHAANCGSLPSLQRTLSSEYCGIIQAVWGCDQGHDFTMDTDSSCRALFLDTALAMKWAWGKEISPRLVQNSESNPSGAASQLCQAREIQVGSETKTLPSVDVALLHSHGNSVAPGLGPYAQPDLAPSEAPGQLGEKQAPASASDDRVKDEFSDLSEGVSGKKSESRDAKKPEEPKIRKKPGPKPGWKKLRCEREELPTIYKCPYQGCTAVYRGADGMKKHIKEHHEEVRERPCPHPGCNKVFMIDRYLQRHVKLIHTEVRNYICDQCGQTFKQRKHLLVHQMRHSGAKPLQCEVCGFQCRQRASLKYHMTKHKAETELDFACDQCGRRFEKAHNLNVHMSMVHPLTQTQDKALPLDAEPPPGPQSLSGTMEAVKPEPT